MISIFLAILAFIVFTILIDHVAIGLVFSGLLIVLWLLARQLTKLNQRIDFLESNSVISAIPEPVSDQESVTPDLADSPLQVSEVVAEEVPSAPDSPPEVTPEPVSTAAKTRPQDSVVSKPIMQETPAGGERKDGPDSRFEPPTPDKPGFISELAGKIVNGIWRWITDGNIFVRVGIIILFMGMTFLIRYAIGENLIPIEFRLAAVAATAIALLVWGWMQRLKRSNFALVVQGGGIGLLYLTIFAGFSLYRVLPSTPAFILLAAIVVLAATLAILQDAKPLALFATVGGFLAPILTSSGSNNYIGLFSYYTVLNIGIFSIAWFKSWRILNFLGFVFTFVISGIWGALSYKPEFFSTTEPFLIIFFLLYVGIAVLFAYRQAPLFKDYVDSSLIFGTPLLAFGMQCALVNEFEYGIAISAFSLAGFYLALTYLLWEKLGAKFRLLCETFLSLGVIFATLAIPFAIDGTLTGATWAIEGAGILWVSIQQKQKYRRLFGAGLIFTAGIILAYELLLSSNAQSVNYQYAFVNSAFMGSTLIAIAASCASWLLSRNFEGKLGLEAELCYGLLAYALFVLLAGFEYQIIEFDLYKSHGNSLAVFSIISSLSYLVAARKLNWVLGHWVSLGFINLIVPAALLSLLYQSQLAANYGYFVWPLAGIANFYILNQTKSIINPKISLLAHFVASALLAGLLFWEGIWQLLLGYSLLAIAFNLLGERLNWAYIKYCALIFLPVLVICSIAAIIIDGNLVDLSSIGSDFSWPFAPGMALWPFGFGAYFYLLFGNRSEGYKYISQLHYACALLIAGLLLWLGLWPLLLGATALCGFGYYLWRQYSWVEMRTISTALLPVMVLVPVIGIAATNYDPFNLTSFNLNMAPIGGLGFVLWPLAFATLYLIYWLSDKEEKPAHGILHAIALLLLVWIVTWKISWFALDLVSFYNAWHLILLPLATLIAIRSILSASMWPYNVHKESYQQFALIPLAGATIVWSFLQLNSSASALPLPWVPVLNPVDIMQAVIVMGWIWKGRVVIDSLPGEWPVKPCIIALLGFVFIWINVDLLRVIHHWVGIEWNFGTLITADISQTSLSILWALLGLVITFYATRKAERQLWLYGATLLGVVILKLFLIDLSAQETIERIVSFTGVGLLLTLVGYFSPLPPRETLIKS